jgi:ankyrin repeat protein
MGRACIVAGALALCAARPALAAADSPVADAAMRRDAGSVRALLKQGADVNAAQGDGMTALHWAASNGDPALARMLLYAGANPGATTRLGGYTPLLMAARLGDAAMIEVLLEGGANPAQATTNGTTPLMFAAASGSAVAVNRLLDHGADIAATEAAMGQTALMFAAAHGRTDVIRALLARGAQVGAASRVTDLLPLTREAEEAFAAAAAGGVGRRQPAAEAPPAASESQPSQGGATAAPAAASPAPEGRPTTDPAAQTEARPAADAANPDAAKPAPAKKPQVGGVDRAYFYNELVFGTGGMTPLLLAVRQGHDEAVHALLAAGADINQVRGGDRSSPLLVAVVNGRFDLAADLLDHGADPRLAAENGVTPLYAALNVQWAPKALYPQPRAYAQQRLTHLDLMKALLDKGADPNARLKKKVWYSGYNFDLSGVDETGATPFWRAAYASDVDAMRLLRSYGADPSLRTLRAAGRPRTGDGQRDAKDVSGLPPVPVGGPAVTPLQAAAGVGYGEGFAANSHRFAPGGMLAAVKYLVEECGADVNDKDHEGNTALHHAAARGDNEMILYLVSKGAEVKAVNREGKTTADMANGPVQRIEPFPETIALLEKLGAKNNHKCVSCDLPKAPQAPR